MNFSQIWDQLVRKDPDLKDANSRITMTSENFERLLRQVYDQGVKTGKAVAEPPKRESGASSIFGKGGIFG